MTWSAAGSPFFAANSSTFSLTPAGVGDLVLVQVANEDSSTIVASALSSSNVTWQQWGSSISNSGGDVTAVQFAGTVTSTSPATVTVTWSGTPPADSRIAGTEFASTTGAWTLGSQGSVNTGGATDTWASLTPSGSLGLLYWGFCLDSVQAVAGSTPGYTYAVDPAHGNGIAYDPACTSGAATAPVWGDSAQVFGIMGVIAEKGGTPHTATAALAVTPAFAASKAQGHVRGAALAITPQLAAQGSVAGQQISSVIPAAVVLGMI